MKTFVTGGTGFIGTHLVRRLAQNEHELVCLVRETSDVLTLEELGATLVRGDVTDRDSVLAGMRGCDWVANLANIYSFWEPDKRVYTEVNVEGTRNVMECALETEVSKVVHVSTSATYGKPADVPFTEESAVGPVRFSEYAETKYQGDLVAEFNEMISEISGVSLPKMRLPDSVAMANATVLTAVADLLKKPPLLQMAIDQYRAMKAGLRADGSKAERELGVTYTSVRVALEEAIASYAEGS